MGIVFIANFNRDYNEASIACRSRDEAVKAIGIEFSVDSNIEPDSVEFWNAVLEAYEHTSWKGLSLLRLDPQTLQIEQLALEPAV